MFFISTTFLKDLTPLSEALNVCNKNNFKFIEIGSNHCYEKNFLETVKNYKFNFLVHNYFPVPKKNFVINIASSEKNIRDRSIRQIYSSINFCSEIGAKLYTFHPGFINQPIAKYNKKNYDFKWNKKITTNKMYINAIDNMYFSLEKIIRYSQKMKVRIAIETEGSYNNHNNLLLQKPEEYEEMKKKFNHREIKINVNIGHLNLASKKFNFNPFDFTDNIKKYIIAFEISHNNGLIDEHKTLKSNAWYWKLFLDKKYNKCYKILELRNTDISKIKKNLVLINKKINENKSIKKNSI